MVYRDVRFDEEKSMRVSIERVLELHVDEETLSLNVEELHIDMKQPDAKGLGVETSTQEKSFRDRRKCTKEADRLLDDARENVGAPTSYHR